MRCLNDSNIPWTFRAVLLGHVKIHQHNCNGCTKSAGGTNVVFSAAENAQLRHLIDCAVVLDFDCIGYGT